MKKHFLCGVLVATLSSGTLAIAAADTDIDQIIVSGARVPLAIRQIGSAVTVIDRVEIERREARLVSDILRSVPGFSVSHTGVTGSQTQVRVRGAEANHVLVLIDGVRANDPATADEFRWEFLSTGSIERIEIVRGPQSSLWGSDAVSAVVYIITRGGGAEPAFDGYLEGGSFGTSNGGVNAAFGDDHWSVNANVEHLSTDGSNISRSGGEKDDSDQTTASLSAKFAASDDLAFRFGLRSVDAYSQFDPTDFFVTGLPADADVATDARSLLAHAGVALHTYDDRVAHRFDVRYLDTDNRDLTDGSEAASTAAERLTIAYQSDIQFDRNILSLAVEHETSDFRQRGATVFGDPNQDQDLTFTSLIAEFQGLANERFSWILSARFDDNSDFDDAFNGRLSATYQLSESTTLRGNVGTGQKNPTFTERFGFFPGQFIGNPDLKPERSTSYDLGVEQRLAGDRVSIELAVFRQDLEDEINGFVFDPVTFLSSAENMQAKSERSGAELALRLELNDSFGISAHYTYTDATEQDFLGNDVRELRRPKHAGGIAANYDFAGERVSVALNADYGGTRTDVFFPPFPDPSEIVTLSNYWLVDLAIQVRATDTIAFIGRGSNLLDEDYEQVFGYQTPGRAAYAGIRVNFGR